MKCTQMIRLALFIVLSVGCEAKPAPLTTATRIWEVEKPDAFGMIVTATRCGDILFLWDTQQHLHRYSFSKQTLLPPLGGDQIGLPFPAALAADCARQVLYLVTLAPMGRGASAAVQAMDMNSGKVRQEYPLPNYFIPRTGAIFVPPATLEMSGLWVPPQYPIASLLGRPAERYYEGLSIGVTLPLSTGEPTPVVAPYETICIGAGQCADVHSDVVATGRRMIRVVALPASDAIGIYESDTSQPRRVSVGSKMFMRTGEKLQVNYSADARMRWLGANSAITGIFAFEEGFAITHTRWLIGPDFHLGERVAFTTHMNTYDWSGTPVRLDRKVTDIPVGRDDKTIFVVDYGGEGRQDGMTKLKIAQINPFLP